MLSLTWRKAPSGTGEGRQPGEGPADFGKTTINNKILNKIIVLRTVFFVDIQYNIYYTACKAKKILCAVILKEEEL